MPGCVADHFIDAIDIPVFAVHDCEVAVDTETGHVEVLSYRDLGQRFPSSGDPPIVLARAST
jgi:hypothetical protein